MQYYDPHKETVLVGKLSYTKPDTMIVTDIGGNGNGSIFNVKSNNRGFDGDLVYYEHIAGSDSEYVNVVGIKERSLKRLVGILQITSTKIYGHSKRGLPIYSFVPLSWRFPNFQVASSVKNKWNKNNVLRNVYTLIEYDQWTQYQKYPSGKCINIIGTITDIVAEEQALLHKNDLYFKRHQQHLETTATQDFKRQTYDHSCNIMAIDPAGSTDLDDAFHLDDDHIYVHIADVDSIFSKDNPYEHELYKRITTIYGKNTYHMLPPGFGDGLLSLNTDGWKNTVTVVLDHDLNGTGWHLSKIQVTKCMSYDEAQHLVTDHPLDKLSAMTGTTDTHKIIEAIMVASNNYIGTVLFKQGLSLVRTMTDKIPEIGHSNPVLDYIKYRSLKGAKYVVYDGNSGGDGGDGDFGHGGLNKLHYVHFTSPIRRYADLIVHRLLKDKDSYTKPELIQIADALNDNNTKTKRYYRDVAVMELFHSITEPCTVEGYIVDYNMENNNIHVYLPSFKIEYRYPLFDDKLSNIMSVVDSTESISLTNKQTEQTWNIPKFELLDVDLSTNWTVNRLNRKVIMRLKDISITFM